MRITYQGDLRFVCRHLPVLDQESARAAEAVECAGEQGRFREYHDALFGGSGGENTGALDAAKLRLIAQNLRLNPVSFGGCMGGGRYTDLVQRETRGAGVLNVRSVPTAFINGRCIQGLLEYGEYREIIEEELALAR